MNTSRNTTTYNTKDIIAIGLENIKELGYNKTSDYTIPIEQSTKYRVLDRIDKGGYPKAPNHEVEEFLKWVNDTQPDSDYAYKAKAACNSPTCTQKDFSFILSYISVYLKYLERKAAEEKRAAQAAVSEYAGEVGEKIFFKVVEWKILYWKDPYAYNSDSAAVYRLVDTDGHIIIWSTTSDYICDEAEIKGTVKKLQEYRGEKQTVITRGKIIYSPEKEKELERELEWERAHNDNDSLGPALSGIVYDEIG